MPSPHTLLELFRYTSQIRDPTRGAQGRLHKVQLFEEKSSHYSEVLGGSYQVKEEKREEHAEKK